MSDNMHTIFRLSALNNYTSTVFKLTHNKPFYVPPETSIAEASTTRESTPDTTAGDMEWEDNDCDRLYISFNHLPKNARFHTFGSSTEKCDVVLGTSRQGISAQHFTVGYDENNQLVLRDNSKFGTTVTYGGQGRNQKRTKENNFSWIIFPGFTNIEVVIGEDIPTMPTVKFRVESMEPVESSLAYTTLKYKYMRDLRMSIPLDLCLDSTATTAVNSGALTPRNIHRIWLQTEKIGGGMDGDIFKIYDVSTGALYAAKLLRTVTDKTLPRFIREVNLLKKLSHNHIIKFEKYESDEGIPRLIMEYISLGNLSQEHERSPFSPWETLVTIDQVSDGLDYLHGLQIVHRDIKPPNLLVAARRQKDRTLHIKIADFGLSTDSELRTYCGTKLYTAPEEEGRNEKIDIWSLGIVALELSTGLPEYAGFPRAWMKVIAQTIEKRDSGSTTTNRLLDFIGSSMLQEKPSERHTADQCREEARIIHLSVFLPQSLSYDPGTPTEKCSSSNEVDGRGTTEHPQYESTDSMAIRGHEPKRQRAKSHDMYAHTSTHPASKRGRTSHSFDALMEL